MKIISISKRTLFFIGIIVAAIHPAFAGDVGVSISVGQPGFYGRIDIGDYPYPQPVLIYREPRIIHRHTVVVDEPVYVHVPPGHARRWHYYCGRYDACDRPVYFVQERWYNEVYVPQYRERHGDHHDAYYENWDRGDRGRDRRGRGHHRGHGRD